MIWEWIGIVSNWNESYTTWCIIQRLFAIVNLMHCLSWYLQFEGLMGEEGIDPINERLKIQQRNAEKEFFKKKNDVDKADIVKKKKQFTFLKFRFLRYPTLFWLSTSPFFIKLVLSTGILCSLTILLGLQYCIVYPITIVMLWWTNCLINSSIRQAAKAFALQTEAMMVEATFLFGLSAIFSLPLLSSLLSPIFTKFIFIKPITNFENEPINANHQIYTMWTNQFEDFIGHIPNVPIILLRWLCFRTMMSAGLVKLFGSSHWRNLSAMSIHYLTQPLLNPLSRFFYSLPNEVHSMETFLSLVIESILPPIAILLPFSATRYICGGCFVGLMALINSSGVYSYLPLLSSVISLSNFDDYFFHYFISPNYSSDFLSHFISTQSPFLFSLSFTSFSSLTSLVLLLIGSLIVLIYIPLTIASLSYAAKLSHHLPLPLKNLFIKVQHTSLVHIIGFFATMTTYRWEIIVEGSYHGEGGEWKRYNFPYKISHPNQTPKWNRFYYWPRLDWLLWFIPLRVRPLLPLLLHPLHPSRHPLHRSPVIYPQWIDRFAYLLLHQNRNVLKLVNQPTFNVGGIQRPPRHIRFSFYDYRFALKDDVARSLEAENALRDVTSIIIGAMNEMNEIDRQIPSRTVPKVISDEDILSKLDSIHQTIGEWFIETGPIAVLTQLSIKDD